MAESTSSKARPHTFPLRWHVFGLRRGGLLVIALGLAALADFLFFRQWIGWTLGGFFAVVLGVLLWRSGRALLPCRASYHGVLGVGLAFGLVAAMVIEPGVLAFLLLLIALGSLALMARGGWPAVGLGWRWLSRVGWVWLCVWAQPVIDCRLARRWRRRFGAELVGKGIAAVRALWGIAGIVVPLALVLVFVGLFSIANPVIAKWMGERLAQAGDFLGNLTDHLTFGRLMLWFTAGIGSWGLLRYRYRSGRVSAARSSATPPPDTSYLASQNPWGDSSATASELAAPPPASPPAKPPAALPEAKVSRDWLAKQIAKLAVKTLIILNGIFLIQLMLDGQYLLLGASLPEGMTYAQYAHRGAYPLMLTALLAGGLVLAVFRPGGAAERSDWARGLVLLWIVQNVALMLTAAWRLGLYVEVYALTRLRFAAAVWMLMVAGGLVLLLWRIAWRHSNTWLTGRTMGWGLAVLYLCCFIPFDPLIAGFNVSRCQEMDGPGGPIDVRYLERLGPDAMPAIDRLLAELPESIAEEPSAFEPDSFWGESSRGARYSASSGRDDVVTHHQSLHDELTEVRAALSKELNSRRSGWRGWTARRAWLAWATQSKATREMP